MSVSLPTRRVGILLDRLLINKVAAALGVPAGRPFGSMGEVWTMDPDRFDAVQWHALQWGARRCSTGAGLEELFGHLDDEAIYDEGFDGAVWDDFPGIGFARAVECASTLVVPSLEGQSFTCGGLALSSVAEGRAFLEAIIARFELPASTLDLHYDDSLPRKADDALYNLRLLSFHLREVEKTGRPLGIWG